MSSSDEEDVKKSKRAKTLVDEQRIKLEKLMANPDKEIYIPELKTDASKPRAFHTHEFVRNVIENKLAAESKTAKKREKRLKAKEKLKNKKTGDSKKAVEDNSNEREDASGPEEELEEVDLTVKVDEEVKPADTNVENIQISKQAESV